jgi:hypothetical protein
LVATDLGGLDPTHPAITPPPARRSPPPQVGRARYLAIGGLVVLAVYVPLLALAVGLGGGLVWIWAVFSVAFMGARFVVLVLRARGDHWLVTGASA